MFGLLVGQRSSKHVGYIYPRLSFAGTSQESPLVTYRSRVSLKFRALQSSLRYAKRIATSIFGRAQSECRHLRDCNALHTIPIAFECLLGRERCTESLASR